jgi:RNA polymerase sigma-70 factor, ECF subfamily
MPASYRRLMTSHPDHCSDDSLVAAVAAGEADAFAALFRRRHRDVYRFALHLTGSHAVSDDVTQDVFLVVMRDAGRYQPGRTTVTAWLCGIARNCARQRLARDRALQPIGDAGDGWAEDDGPAVHPDPLGDLTRAERIEMLRRAVLTLPLRYREVVVLCDLQELSYAEAASALGCAIGTVRSRLHRGRSMLADKLAASPECRPESPAGASRLSPRGTRCLA